MRIERYVSEHAAEHISAFLDLYTEVYGVPPYSDDPFFSVDAYAKRLQGAMAMPCFEIVTCTVDGLLVGVGHGVTLPAAVLWWHSLNSSLPAHLAEPAETGNIFWLRELQVRQAYRNQGIGRNCTTTCAQDEAKPSPP